MQIRTLLFGSFLIVATPLALASQDLNVSGTWLSDADASVKWIVDQQKNEIHIQEMDGSKINAEFTCPLTGQECPVKYDGRAEKMMMYFNGGKLVQIREHNEDTAKRRMSVSADGKILTVETVPLDAKQKAGTVTFRRQMG